MLHDTTCALNIEQVEERLEWKLLQYDSATMVFSQYVSKYQIAVWQLCQENTDLRN